MRYYTEEEYAAVLTERRPMEGDCVYLETIPFDHDGCHSTGVQYYDGKEWWNEYSDNEGTLFYGR